MEESQRSETVAVLADMSEPLASGTEEQNNKQQRRAHQVVVATTSTTAAAAAAVRAAATTTVTAAAAVHPVAVATNVAATGLAAGVGVPVSLPVGSIIGATLAGNGTTFNVITSDQLQLSTAGQFKQMLCVDNSFICETKPDKNDPLRWNGAELKATHIVIQNSANDGEAESIQIASGASNSLAGCSWSECASLAVLPIRCKNTNAELYKNRFGSGGRGRCIRYNNTWYTPSEFEALCGRASSKDWKRSIRFGGRSLQTLIDENILRPHATSCTCSACCDDDSAAGPIRLFTPYKRRRRTRDNIDEDGPPRKVKEESSRDGSNADDSDSELISDKGCWSSFVATDELVVQHVPKQEDIVTNIVNPTENGHSENKYHKLDELSNKLIKIANEFKKVVEEYKAEESRQQIRDQNLVAQLNVNRADVIETVGLQRAADSKKCANCNRDAFSECSLCRRTSYCTTFCQRKDWENHQIECVRDAAGTVMLIVDSSSADTTITAAQQTEQ